MDHQALQPARLTSSAPGLSVTIFTDRETFCPACGYALLGVSTVFLSFEHTHAYQPYTTAAVCSKCYESDLQGAVVAASLLDTGALFRHVTRSHGILFWTPRDADFLCRSAHAVYAFLAAGTPLPPLPPSAFLPQRQPVLNPQHHFEFDPQPSPNEPPDYDPPCPADIEAGRPH